MIGRMMRTYEGLKDRAVRRSADVLRGDINRFYRARRAIRDPIAPLHKRSTRRLAALSCNSLDPPRNRSDSPSRLIKQQYQRQHTPYERKKR
jgi:hypothetical protein